MVEIRTEAKTWVITDEGEWIKVWDAREPLKPEELGQVSGGLAGDHIMPPMVNM